MNETVGGDRRWELNKVGKTIPCWKVINCCDEKGINLCPVRG